MFGAGFGGDIPVASKDFMIVSFLKAVIQAAQNRGKKSPFFI
jgi:hypothetical protein